MDDLDVDDARRALIAALPALSALVAAAPARAQKAELTQPLNYRVAFENAYVRVLDFTSRPGMGVCGSGIHSHPRHLTVPLTPGAARITVGGKTMTMSAEVGGVFWEEAVTHEVENVSGANMRALLIELKSPPGRT